MTRIIIELKERFCDLAGQLSPENLSCDGELPAKQVAARRKRLMTEWAGLEKQVGRRVSESETYDWWQEVKEHLDAKRKARIAQQPSHPLMQSQTPGVWRRMGSNNMAAFYVQGPALHGGERYELYSEFASLMFGKEHMGSYDTLDEAFVVGERFISGITPDRMQREMPRWTPENIMREIRRLPTTHLSKQGIS